MKYISINLGMMPTNSYILFDEKTLNCAIIDPADNFEKINRYLQRYSLNLKYILLTHGHIDHIGAVNDLIKNTKAKCVMSNGDIDLIFNSTLNQAKWIFNSDFELNYYPDIILYDGDVLSFDNVKIECFHTPGHTQGSCIYLCENVMFSGDTIFKQSYGRTDLYGGNQQQLFDSLKKIYKLDCNYIILPGHMGITTLDEERNLFI